MSISTNYHLPGVLFITGYLIATPGFTESGPTDDENNDATESIQFNQNILLRDGDFPITTGLVRLVLVPPAVSIAENIKSTSDHQNQNININNIERRTEIHQ